MFLASLFAVLVALAGQSEPRDFSAQMRQNRDSFVRIDVLLDRTTSIPAQVGNAADHEIAYADLAAPELAKVDLPPEFVDQLQRLAVREKKTFEEVKLRWVNQAVAGRKEAFARLQKEAGASATISRRYIQTPTSAEIQYYLAEEDARRAKAMQQGILSIHDGDFIRIQSTGPRKKWIALEPYSYVAGGPATAWQVERLMDEGAIPPYIDVTRMENSTGLGLHHFYGEPANDLKYAGTVSVRSDTATILARSVSKSEFWICAINDERSGIPFWVTKWFLRTGVAFESLKAEDYASFAQTATHLMDNPVADEVPKAVLSSLYVFDDLKHVPHAGIYPHTTKVMTIELIRTSSARLGEGEGPRGWGRVETMKVVTIAANEDVKDIQPFELADGTGVVDLDTKESIVLGATPETAIKQLVNTRFGRSAWMLLINVAAVALIALTYRARRRAASAERLAKLGDV